MHPAGSRGAVTSIISSHFHFKGTLHIVHKVCKRVRYRSYVCTERPLGEISGECILRTKRELLQEFCFLFRTSLNWSMRLGGCAAREENHQSHPYTNRSHMIRCPPSGDVGVGGSQYDCLFNSARRQLCFKTTSSIIDLLLIDL